jgi:hypothetical protein
MRDKTMVAKETRMDRVSVPLPRVGVERRAPMKGNASSAIISGSDIFDLSLPLGGSR